MKRIVFAFFVICMLGTCACSSRESMEEAYEGESEVERTTFSLSSEKTVYVYVPKTVQRDSSRLVPMVLVLHGTQGDAKKIAIDCGWITEAAKQQFIIVTPEYDCYSDSDEVTKYLADVVDYAATHYQVDTERVYVNGFSYGGVVATCLCQDYPQLFAAIAPMGWMGDVENVKNLYKTWDMPFQVIQGVNDNTYRTEYGDMAVMEDEQRSIRDLLLLNEMIEEKDTPNYNVTPYWGYGPMETASRTLDGWQFQYSNYYKTGYASPFAQLVLIEGAEHIPNINGAKVAWDFFHHFKREKSGRIIELP